MGGSGNLNIVWSNGQSGTAISGLSAGTYSFTITDENGCSMDSSIVLEEPARLELSATSTPPTCFDREDGIITIATTGGTPPFQYQVNAQQLSQNNIATGIGIGLQDIFVQDSNGCTNMTSVEVVGPEELLVTASADPVVVNLGEQVTLSAESVNGIGTINFQWSAFDNTQIECDDCREAQVMPFRSASFEVIAIDENGCQISDLIDVEVNIDRSIHVPTGFTPDSDGPQVNNQLHVHGLPGATINSFQVYNRWGELLYEVADFSINDMNIGWDGTFRGKPAPAGVYIWRIEATFIDGFKKAYEGQTNLIR